MTSYHNLITGTVTLKLWKTKRGQERANHFDSKRPNNDELKTALRLEQINRFNALEEEQNITIANFSQAIREAGLKVLGQTTTTITEWINRTHGTKISERKETKQKSNAARLQS